MAALAARTRDGRRGCWQHDCGTGWDECVGCGDEYSGGGPDGLLVHGSDNSAYLDKKRRIQGFARIPGVIELLRGNETFDWSDFAEYAT
jgi:hypothetical protein